MFTVISEVERRRLFFVLFFLCKYAVFVNATLDKIKIKLIYFLYIRQTQSLSVES